MDTISKILSGILILITLYMGVKQGWPMITGKTEMLDMLAQWQIGKNMALIMGIFVLAGAILVLFPQTFFYGNAITAIVIVYVLASQLSQRDLQSAMIEIPFLIIPLVLIYLRHPLVK